MSGLYVPDVRELVVRPSQLRLGMWSQEAENIVVGIGLAESRLERLDQSTPGPGPAYGLWQMEKLTHDDLWVTYLPQLPEHVRDALWVMAGTPPSRGVPPVTVLQWNLLYASAMCRLKLRRAKPPLPVANDAAGMAAYWKQWYNTPEGKGTIEGALPFFKQAVT